VDDRRYLFEHAQHVQVNRIHQPGEALVALAALDVAELFVLTLAGFEVRPDARQQRVDQVVLKPRKLPGDEGDAVQVTVWIGALVKLGESTADDATGEVGDALASEIDRLQHVVQLLMNRPAIDEVGDAARTAFAAVDCVSLLRRKRRGRVSVRPHAVGREQLV